MADYFTLGGGEMPASAAEAAADMSEVLPIYNRIDFYEDMGRHMGDEAEAEPKSDSATSTARTITRWLPWIGLAFVGMMVIGAAGRPSSRREI